MSHVQASEYYDRLKRNTSLNVFLLITMYLYLEQKKDIMKNLVMSRDDNQLPKKVQTLILRGR